ncbi:MAG: hypothetical protein LUD79_07140 [Oscillospiraceae bacterium]|nr:hypothetical protein [Oscillospiraceae bacterium]
MKQWYSFAGETPIEFDDEKSIRELIAYAFNKFGYYEPLGMDIVTVFQSYHPATITGWFTVDVNQPCANEIRNRDWLCFAYYMPNVFYFAEGGWGHHMPELGNHPDIPNAVSIKFALNGETNTIVINGNLTCRSVITKLMDVGYLDANLTHIKISQMDYRTSPHNRMLYLHDPTLDIPLTEFDALFNEYYDYIVLLDYEQN